MSNLPLDVWIDSRLSKYGKRKMDAVAHLTKADWGAVRELEESFGGVWHNRHEHHDENARAKERSRREVLVARYMARGGVEVFSFGAMLRALRGEAPPAPRETIVFGEPRHQGDDDALPF